MRNPVIFAAFLSSVTLFACASTDHVTVAGSSSGNPASGASPTDPAVADAASFCKAMCDRVQTCDASLDAQTCENQCANTNAAVFPRLRSDVVGLIVGCFDAKDCKTVLGSGFVGACTADAIASVAPSAAASMFCDALAASKKTCSGADTATKADCLNSAKLYGDDAIAEAQNCVKRGCTEIDSCVSAVFGSLGGVPAKTTTTTTTGSCTGKFSDLGNCETCAETSCCTETTACYADSSCGNLLRTCMVNGTSTTACSQAYASASTSSQQLASAVLSCSSSKCTTGTSTCKLGGG